METIHVPTQQDRMPLATISCPACGQALLDLGGFCRCIQCGYHICISCEPEADGDDQSPRF